MPPPPIKAAAKGGKRKKAPPPRKKGPPGPSPTAKRGGGPPPPPKRGPPAPPVPTSVVSAARDNDAHLGAIAQAGAQRAAASEARAEARDDSEHLDAIKQGAAVRGFSALMGAISSGGASELHSVETVDKSAPVLESSGKDVSENPIDLVKGLIPHFPDTKEFLRKVETVDKSVPVIDDGVKITFNDPSDTLSPHLKAIQAAAEKRSYRLMMKLKQELSSLFTSSGVSLERAFRGFDENRDGAIDHGEFSRGLTKLGAQLSASQLDDLISILDKDGDGTIDYVEFARWFGAGPPPPPVLPEVALREEAREAAAVDDPAAHLKAIRQGAVKMGSAISSPASPPAIPQRSKSPAARSRPAAGKKPLPPLPGKKRAPAPEPEPQAAASAEATAVVSSMVSCSEDPRAQHAGCYALWKMLYGDASQRRAVHAAGGVGVLVDALALAPDHAGLQEAGCAALASLVVEPAAARQAASAGAKQMAIVAMQSHPGAAAVQAAALVLLANLSG